MIADGEKVQAQKDALIDCYIEKNDLAEEMSLLSKEDVPKYRESICKEVFMSRGSYCGNYFMSLGRGRVRVYVDAVKDQFGGTLALS